LAVLDRSNLPFALNLLGGLAKGDSEYATALVSFRHSC